MKTPHPNIQPVKASANCPQCKGQGFFFRLPPNMNPFAASIEVTARNMRRISCWCTDTEADANEHAAGGKLYR